MGISGLLPFLKKASKKTHIRHFSGYTVAVDTYCWLHRGAFGCAQKLGTGEPTTAYITYCLKYINVLRENGLTPILVFDGRNLPSKAVTEKKRRESRQENREKAREALRLGNKKEAWEYFTRCVDITPAMARELIKVCRQEKLDYVIAPYEADAQLAYMARKGIVDMIITEDSDLVLFGCPKVFFKMSVNGDGVFFDQSKIHLCMGQTPEQFQFEKFRHMCILSGCDYLPSIPGIGLGRAKKLITMSTNPDIAKMIKKIPSILKIEVTVPENYLSEFERAENTFLYQLVFDPLTRTLVPLTPYLPGVDPAQLTYCGKYEKKALALDMALGNVDIKSLERVDNFNIDDKKGVYCTAKSMWSKGYRIKPRLNAAEELKKNTKHASTAGKHLVVSGVVLVKKRPMCFQEHLQDTESNEEEILALYTNGKAEIKTESNDALSESRQTRGKRLIMPNTRTTRSSGPHKRMRMNSVYDKDTSDSGDETKNGSCKEEDANDSSEDGDEKPLQEPQTSTYWKIAKFENGSDATGIMTIGSAALRSSARSNNPFIKPQQNDSTKVSSNFAVTQTQKMSATGNTNGFKKTLSLSRKPVCLVTKNKVYETDPNVTITVKSKYWRTGTPTFLGGGLRSGLFGNTNQK